jgi:hypothetical protein
MQKPEDCNGSKVTVKVRLQERDLLDDSGPSSFAGLAEKWARFPPMQVVTLSFNRAFGNPGLVDRTTTKGILHRKCRFRGML